MLLTEETGSLDRLIEFALASIDIPPELYERAVARYQRIGEAFDDYWSTSRSSGAVYPQGSFRLGTVVRPITEQDEYDIDLVARRDLAKSSTTQAGLKQDVGRASRHYLKVEAEDHPRLEEGKRCWTLDYPNEPFHMDVLPAIPDPDSAGDGILLTDRDLRAWLYSDPIGFATWFHQRAAEERRELVLKAMAVEPVPEWGVRTTLQRAVQALKRHRDLYFREIPDDRPASIIVTTLAAQAYRGAGGLLDVIVDITLRMPQFVEVRDGALWIPNPVQPAENFADRWRDHPERARLFQDWLQQAHADFDAYRNDRGLDRTLTEISKSLGPTPAERAAKAMGDAARVARTTGRLGLAAGGLLTTSPSMAQRPVPGHQFHGDH